MHWYRLGADRLASSFAAKIHGGVLVNSGQWAALAVEAANSILGYVRTLPAA